MSQKILLNALIGLVLGVTLASLGFPFTTWQYWIIMALWGATIASSVGID